MVTIKEYVQTNPHFHKTVVGYPVIDDKVLLGLRKKVSFGLGENLVSGIGGKCEENELEQEALVREFAEETEMKPTEFEKMGEVIFLFPHKPKWNQVCTPFLITQWEHNPVETDVIKPMWIPKDELPKAQMWEDNLFWIPLVLQGRNVKGVFLYNEQNKVIEHTLEEST